MLVQSQGVSDDMVTILLEFMGVDESTRPWAALQQGGRAVALRGFALGFSFLLALLPGLRSCNLTTNMHTHPVRLDPPRRVLPNSLFQNTE